jgi:hypothetical protein
VPAEGVLPVAQPVGPGREDRTGAGRADLVGWLSTQLPAYPEETLNLKTEVHTDEVGARPHVALEPTDHPLALERRTGITVARVQEIAELLLDPKA